MPPHQAFKFYSWKNTLRLLSTRNGLLARYGNPWEPGRCVGIQNVASEPIISVAASLQHALAATVTGKLIVWGTLECATACLGSGPKAPSRYPRNPGTEKPTILKSMSDHRIVQVAAGSSVMYALSSEGKVFAWGQGNQFGMGTGRLEVADVPKTLTGLQEHFIVQISAGANHAGALTSDGRVFSWGDTHQGSTGHGIVGEFCAAETVVLAPRLVCGLEGKIATQIAFGQAHSCVVTKDGQLFTFGWGEGLGHGPRKKSCSVSTLVEFFVSHRLFVSMVATNGHSESTAVIAGGKLFKLGSGWWGRGTSTSDGLELFPALVAGELAGCKVVDVSMGRAHLLAVTADGKLFAMGLGDDGALGIGREDTEGIAFPIPRDSCDKLVQVVANGLETQFVLKAFTGDGLSYSLTRP